MLSNLIGGFVIIIVGTALLPVIANQIALAQTTNGTHPGNLTGASSTIAGLITLFYALSVTAAAIALCITGLKSAGLM